MIADTTFLGDFQEEMETGRRGPARAFLAAHRRESVLVTVISLAEMAVIFESNQAAREFLGHYRTLRLKPEIAYTAADVDRELIAGGGRLGENDNWIAGFCRYYGQPIIIGRTSANSSPAIRDQCAESGAGGQNPNPPALELFVSSMLG